MTQSADKVFTHRLEYYMLKFELTAGQRSWDDPTDLAYALENNSVTASSDTVKEVLGFIQGENDGPDAELAHGAGK